MKAWLLFSISIVLLCSASARSQQDPLIISEKAFLEPSLASVDVVELAVGRSIVLEGMPKQIERLKRWLYEIAAVPKGYKTLRAIHTSGHVLTIRHSDAARLSAGRTIAPMTERLTNGIGDNITIIFDAEMSRMGTHHVYDRQNRPLEFNAVQNLFHELAHAMHQMQGQWRYFASEAQAIEEENIFRMELALLQGKEPRLRYRSHGRALDFARAYSH